MIELTIPGMSCDGCVNGVTKAVKGLDPDARVEVDLASKQVRVESTQDRKTLAEALAKAGYEPQ